MVFNELQKLDTQVDEAMRSRLGDANSVVWLDFPDYDNVGDSAIWLGQHAWAKRHGIEELFSVPQRAITPALMRRIPSSAVGVINGGGNFGGLWKNHHRARVHALEGSKGRRLLQAPQSILFPSPTHLQQLASASAEVDFCVLARDTQSLGLVESVFDTSLSPDAAHMLGALESLAPQRPTSWLLRKDKERTHAMAQATINHSFDWPSEDTLERRVRKLRYEVIGRLGLASSLCLIPWVEIAATRVARGLEMLSRGEVVVTDRLHAMILGLHLGRRVIAIDSNVRKLSQYAATWFDFGPPWLYWAKDINEAVSIRESL